MAEEQIEEKDSGQVWCCSGLTSIGPDYDGDYDSDVWHCSGCERNYPAAPLIEEDGHDARSWM